MLSDAVRGNEDTAADSVSSVERSRLDGLRVLD